MSTLPIPDGRSTEPMTLLRKHIFAINSEPDFLNVIRELFQEERFNVTTTNYLPATFDAIVAFQPSLVLIDLRAGDGAGAALLQRLSTEPATRAIPLVITSTDRALLDWAAAERPTFTAQRLLIKPLQLAELLAAVNDLVGAA